MVICVLSPVCVCASSSVRCLVRLQSIKFIAGAPALSAESTKGCGYDLTGIMRIVLGSRKYIRISPVLRDNLRFCDCCVRCNRTIKTGATWCSLGCKVSSLVHSFVFVIPILYKLVCTDP